ncbi:D-alanyl-D-alanine dipeptidase [Mesorhizobium sp. URHB0026]
MTLVVFDCYRPARAVADMGHWTAAGGPPDPQWYPTVKRGDLIAKGYVGERSSHSRGSTVDVAIGPVDSTPVPKPACGAINADTVDFGTGFDCFDPMSETAHRPLGAEAAANESCSSMPCVLAGSRTTRANGGTLRCPAGHFKSSVSISR